MAFPATALGVTLEVALSADLTADPSDWAWTDATAYVRLSDGELGITIERGGRDGSLQSPSSVCTFWADNRDGRWVPTNPAGAWYGQLTKGTPVRVVVDEGTPSVRWTGFLTSLPPRWDITGNDSFVQVTASGILQRLQRGSTPLRSPLVRAISGLDPVAYWPGEDGSQSTSIAEFSGGPPMRIVGQVATLADDAPPGSDPLPEFTTVSGVDVNLPGRSSTNEWTAASIINFPASPAATTSVLRWYTNGTYPFWQITIVPGTPDQLTVEAYDSSGTQQIAEDVAFQDTGGERHGDWVLIAVTAAQDGADVDYVLYLGDADVVSAIPTATETGITAGIVTRAGINANSKVNGMKAGHWAVWDEALSAFDILKITAALNGGDGDSVDDRVGRLSLEVSAIEGKVNLLGAASYPDQTMGPQTRDATFLDLVREAEAVGHGRLFENMDPTSNDRFLYMGFRDWLENQAADLALDHDSGHLSPPFEPVDDDQHLRNDWTATRSGASGVGSSARAVATSGNLKPSDVGTYADSVSVNVETDDQLIHQASWRLNEGIVEGLRFPVVTVDFARNPGLIDDWITCDIGSRITITNPPTGIAPDDIDLIVEGWTEVFGPFTWYVTLNCSPYKPWRVIEMADTTGDTNVDLGRYAEDENCALRVAIDDNDLSMDVDPNRKRWTTAADDFPMDVRLGGEVVTVSAVSTDAATFIAVGAASHADNAAVSPALYAGHTTDHVIFVVGAIRSSGTGTLSITTGYTRLPVFRATDNVQIWAKVHDGSESNPTVTPADGSAGDTVSAFTFGLGNAAITLADLGDIVVDSIAQLNASAANISYGGLWSWQVAGCVQLIVAWKQDDLTSIAVPSGFTEMIEASSTTGNDQSLYCAYRIDTTPAVVNGDSLAVTGGASAISRSAVVAIAGGKHVMTISARSVNGVTKSHAVGTKVAVEDAGVLGS